MGTTGRFGGGGHGLTGPKHIWYDTDYSELYKGLAVVIGFFLFLVLLLLVFILISYLRKWYRLKKRPTADASAVVPVEGANQVSSVKTSTLSSNLHEPNTIQQSTAGYKKHSRVGLTPNSSQPQTPLAKTVSGSKSTPPAPPPPNVMTHYQEFPPGTVAYPVATQQHPPPPAMIQHPQMVSAMHHDMRKNSNPVSVMDTHPRTPRLSLATITLS